MPDALTGHLGFARDLSRHPGGCGQGRRVGRQVDETTRAVRQDAAALTSAANPVSEAEARAIIAKWGQLHEGEPACGFPFPSSRAAGLTWNSAASGGRAMTASRGR